MKNFVANHPFILFLIILPFFLYNIFLGWLVFSLLGLYLCLDGYFTLKKIEESGIECEGKIVKFVKGHGTKTPLVEFTTQKGELIKEEPMVYASINIIQAFTITDDIGKTVLLKYHPDDPKEFIFIDDDGNNSFLVFIGILICFGFVVFAVCGLLGYIEL